MSSEAVAQRVRGRGSIAMLPLRRRNALDREHALKLLDELVETRDRLMALRRRRRELAELERRPYVAIRP